MINKIKSLHLSYKITGSLVVVLAIFNLIGSNLLATRGEEVDLITTQTLTLEKENVHLSNQIARLSSLSYIEEKANSLGFEKISKPIALTPPAPVAYLSQ